jgi:hypothetical protein
MWFFEDISGCAAMTILTGAFYVGNGWVSGGCWDYYE